jgi:hypothetical protein
MLRPSWNDTLFTAIKAQKAGTLENAISSLTDAENRAVLQAFLERSPASQLGYWS